MGVLAAAQVSHHQMSVDVSNGGMMCVRRAEPPTEKEVLQSLALAQMKKINAAKLEETRRDEMLAAGKCSIIDQ